MQKKYLRFETDVIDNLKKVLYSTVELIKTSSTCSSYEIPTKDQNGNETSLVPVILREKTKLAAVKFGQPLFVQVPASGTTYEELYRIVIDQLSRNLTSPPNPEEQWWNNEPTNDLGSSPVNASSTSTSGTFFNVLKIF